MAFGSDLGFGLMQGGGSFGGPLAMQRARDPRAAYARALMEAGSSGAPVASTTHGLARAGQALVGAWLARDANQDWDNRENNRAMAIANALKDASGTPAETKSYSDGTTINWNAVKPDMNRAIAGLAANKDTADMAAQWQKNEMDWNRQRAATAEDRGANQQFTLQRDQLQNDFGTARDNLNRAHAEYMQDRSAANQFKLQAAQQQFSAAEGALNRTFQRGQQERAQNFQLNNAGTLAQRQAEGTLAAQNAPVTIQTPNGPQTVPAGAAVKVASGSPLTDAQKKEYTDKNLKFDAVDSALGRYEKLLKEGGPSLLGVAGAPTKLSSAYQDTLLELKELFNLGVLNGPDLELMQKTLADPNSLKGAATHAMGGLQPQIDLIKEKLKGARAQLNQNYGMSPKAAVGGDPLGIR